MTHPTITLHGTRTSGHTHRVEWLLRLLRLPYRYSEAPASVRASEAFRRLNPLGQIPVLQDDEQTLCDSNAIMVYLVKRYSPDSDWLPDDPATAAEVQRWFSLAAGELKNGPATARLITRWNAPGDLKASQEIALRFFGFMDQYLAGRNYLVSDHPTLVDLAHYYYTARAPEGGIALDAFPHINAWLRRMESVPEFPEG
ncbi:glutathione S-transferase [Betaproteobacteria bacterium]|nr:glutathione S-transferase [Betaproteobacteria bacterium]